MGKMKGSDVEELQGYLALHDSFAVRRVALDTIPGAARNNSEERCWVTQSTSRRKTKGKVAY